jgi:hypothetical protein
MKKILTILALFITSLSSAQFSSTDDKIHLTAGAIISGVTYNIVFKTTKNKKKAFWYSLGVSTLAGFAKEVYDSTKDDSKFDTGEWVATTTGGLVVSTTISLFVGKNKHENNKNIALVN